MSPPANPYNLVPYDSYPYPQTDPARLGAVAALCGAAAPSVSNARVLELGCAGGGNLVPLAARSPGGAFLGIDASARQVADGSAAVTAAGLANVELRHLDLMDVTPELGQFDYILCHGVYSWVPPSVQDRILSICRENLAPGGVAYVSYNTLPGWRMRGIVRDAMNFRARAFSDPADRVRSGRALVDVLARSVPTEDNAYGILLRNELAMLNSKDDSYLLHEHLEEHNEPLYFHEFMARAAKHGLQYLCEADYGTTCLRNLPEQAAAVIESVAADVIEREQYMDFDRNRMFRQTLLVHADARVDRAPKPERLMGVYVASAAKPEPPVAADLRNAGKVVFRGPRSQATTTTDPLVIAALLHLAEQWPRAVAFPELVAAARSRLGGGAIVDTSAAGRDANRLGETILRCFEIGQVDLSTQPSPFTTTIADRPKSPALARYQAGLGGSVTNGRHEWTRLGDLERHVLRMLDGTRDRDELARRLTSLVSDGSLLLHRDGRPVREAAAVSEIAPRLVDDALGALAKNAFLVE